MIKEYFRQLGKNEVLISILLLTFGVALFPLTITIQIFEKPALIIIGTAYLLIGIGIYGIIKTIVLLFLKVIKLAIKVILADRVKILIVINK